ncbi:MAG TPA: RNA methyltransferase [Chitinophagaceae bacterium]|nr:RNA methyltransferase [Chitinophagaceae bacterium]
MLKTNDKMITKSQVKYIQSLGQKKFREEESAFVAEGPKIINELLETASSGLQALYYTASWKLEYPVIAAKADPTLAHEIKEAELERISFLSTPHQVLGVFKKPVQPAPFRLRPGISLMLDGLQDPGNMGTIIRIADWFGVQQLVCSPDCADAYAPKVVQGSMGSIARVQLLYTPLAAFIQENPGLKLYAATLGGQPLAEAGKLTEGMLVIGNESKGVSREILAAASRQFTIPRVGKAESLNAAVATGILLSHLI